MIHLKRFIPLLLLMACGLPSLAESLKIHGKITDQEEKPVEFATIRIGGTSIGTNSDLEGNYSLSVVANGAVIGNTRKRVRIAVSSFFMIYGVQKEI